MNPRDGGSVQRPVQTGGDVEIFRVVHRDQAWRTAKSRMTRLTLNLKSSVPRTRSTTASAGTPMYGNESEISDALHDSGVPRAEIFVAAKLLASKCRP